MIYILAVCSLFTRPDVSLNACKLLNQSRPHGWERKLVFHTLPRAPSYHCGINRIAMNRLQDAAEVGDIRLRPVVTRPTPVDDGLV